MAGFAGVEKPRIRLTEAVKAYLDGTQTKFNAANLAKQCELVRLVLVEVMGQADPLIDDIDDDLADVFRDRLIKAGKATETVRRRIVRIRTILIFVKTNSRLKHYTNPFNRIAITNSDGLTAKQRRDALSRTEIRACVPAIAAKNQSISDLWVLMKVTGARPNELRSVPPFRLSNARNAPLYGKYRSCALWLATINALAAGNPDADIRL